jgi:nucleotide-binding universal stress UspA family protein
MSFKHVIVPLDGSALAEAAVPPAVLLARRLGGQVTLFHVIEKSAPESVHGERHLRSAEEAQRYLGDVRQAQIPEAIEVNIHVHTDPADDVAQSIVEHAAELGNDLISMCTHGRGGLKDWIYGRIPAKILAAGSEPVLLVQPASDPLVRRFGCQHLLVPLDGDPAHEAGLQIGLELAKSCGASVDLLTVVHTRGELPGPRGASAQLMPRAASVLLELTVENAKDYLEAHVSDLRGRGIAASFRVMRGDPAQAIIQEAEESGIDLIVMGSHGRKGIDAFWAGSVAPRILERSRRPLLVVPIKASLSG